MYKQTSPVGIFFEEQTTANFRKNSKTIWFLQSEFLEKSAFAKISRLTHIHLTIPEILAKTFCSKNSDWRNQMALDFFQNFAAICSLEKNLPISIWQQVYLQPQPSFSTGFLQHAHISSQPSSPLLEGKIKEFGNFIFRQSVTELLKSRYYEYSLFLTY